MRRRKQSDYVSRHGKRALQENHQCGNCTPDALVKRKNFQEQYHSAQVCLVCGGYYPGDCKCGRINGDCCCDGCNTLWRTREQNKAFYDNLYNN